ncbi:DeoR family transcriptional regulator, partial [Klebsiella pneumoniae]|uniref:DeoR family transcriptional regulator n=1 Tax=Klebsiella pneumoniae TaxID=573 RepID=UPI00292F1A52
MNARQQSILQVVIDKGRMSVADLAKMTGVSEVTIRQDLNLLEKQGNESNLLVVCYVQIVPDDFGRQLHRL